MLGRTQTRPRPPTTIHMIVKHMTAERNIYELSMPDKLRACEAFKTTGNMFYREGQFFRAAEKYRMVLVYYEYAFPDTDAQQAALDKLRVDCLLNLASCKLRTRQYDEVIENCTLALAAEPSNSKALFRRAQAHRHKDDLDDAWNDITAAVRLAPKDKALRSEAAAVQARQKRYEERRSRLATAMFGGAAVDDGPAVDRDVFKALTQPSEILPE